MPNLKKYNVHLFPVVFLLVFLAVCTSLNATGARLPMKRIVGLVVDSVSGEPLDKVNVLSKNAKLKTTTDANGIFVLDIPAGSNFEIRAYGFNSKSYRITENIDTLRILLSPASTELSEVVVKPKKVKYSKKNNPAVDLMRRVREDHKKTIPTQAEFYGYDRYDKMVVAINDFNGYIPDEKGDVKGRFKTISSLVDTAIWTGKRILDLSMKEKYSTRITKGDGTDKEIVLAQHGSGIDKQLDENYTRAIFEDMLREVDIFGNDIPIIRNRFVSPLSAIGADFYKYHIEDTVLIGNDRCVELSFAPHNPESTGFNGKLYIPVNDSVKWVRRVLMRLPKAANVNYVENMVLSQTFNRDSLGYVHKNLDDMVVELHIVSSIGQMYMARQSRYANFNYEKNNELSEYYDKLGNLFVIDEAGNRGDGFWDVNRLIPLSHAERQLASDNSPFVKIPFFYWTTKVAEILVKGYLPTSRKSKFDVGPINTLISYNDTEGLRLSLGGMTTANLSKRIFARGYGAYGFKDHRWKYSGELEYSFVDKKYHSHEFPMNSIRLSYRYDVNQIGRYLMSDGVNSFLDSWTRVESNLSTYERLGQLEYNIEWQNHLSFLARLQYQRQESSKYVPFVTVNGQSVPYYTQNSMTVGLRWAKGENFIQTANERINVNKDALIISLYHTFGPKKLFGSEFTLNLTQLRLEKRIWFSAFGYTDIVFNGAKLWNQVQFPALLWQNANISYAVFPESFTLLNPMEFALDQFVSLDLLYNLNGLIFNRIPFIKKLKLREIVSFKGFYGSLTRKNNPDYNDNLFRFPNTHETQTMGSKPYMEFGAGIENILTFLRLEYFWRLTYRNQPGCPNSGLRFAFRFAF